MIALVVENVCIHMMYKKEAKGPKKKSTKTRKTATVPPLEPKF